MSLSYAAVLISSTWLSKMCALFLVNGCPLDLGRSAGFLLVLLCTEPFKGTWLSYFPDWKASFSQFYYLQKTKWPIKVKCKPQLSSHLENQEVGQGNDLVSKSAECASLTTWVQIPGAHMKGHIYNPVFLQWDGRLTSQLAWSVQWIGRSKRDPASKQGGRQDPTPEGYPLTSVWAVCRVHAYTHMRTRTCTHLKW